MTMTACSGTGSLGCSAQELARDNGRVADPTSTDHLTELNLRRLQLIEIRRLMGLTDQATHFEVVRQLVLRRSSVSAIPRRYRASPGIEQAVRILQEGNR